MLSVQQRAFTDIQWELNRWVRLHTTAKLTDVGQDPKQKKKKKIINKAVELCVIQAEVCISWWEDWNFTFRQTVWKCSKTSTAKRSTSMCYTPNDARTEPRVPQTLRGLLLLLWPFAQTRILFTLFNNHPLGQHAPANQNAFWPSSALQWGPPLLSPASHHNGIKKPALSDSWA